MNGKWRAASFFVLRRPLRQAAAAALYGTVAGLALPTDSAALRLRLADDPCVLAALYLSSSSLYEATLQWLELPPHDTTAPPAALMRYLLRALNRPTPFGLFGLLSLGDVGAPTSIRPVTSVRELRGSHRISFESRSAAASQHEVQAYVGNPTLFRHGNEFRAWISVSDEMESCALVSCPVDEVTERLFARPHELRLAANDVLAAGLGDLVSAGLLLPDLPLPSLFQAQPEDSRRAHPDDQILALDALPMNAPDRAQRYLTFDTGHKGSFRSASKRSSIDACAFTCPEFGEPPALSADTAARVAETAANLVANFGRPNSALHLLQAAFSERYTYESTPLLPLLDSDLGEQFTRLLQISKPLPGIGSSEFERYLLEQVVAALSKGQREVTLRWRDIVQKQPRGRSPSGRLVCPVFSLVHDPSNPERQLVLWQGMEVRTGTALLSRFEGIEPHLARAASQWRLNNADVHRDDEVTAEIVYVPHPKHGDVLQRPVSTSHAIYVNGALPKEGPPAIALQSLHLRLRNGEFELWCSTLERRVRPVLSVPHYYQGSQHPVYRFLCALASQHLESARLPLPQAVAELPMCPRLVVDGVVLRPATWTIRLPIAAPERTDLSALRGTLATLGVPLQFSWGELDQVLPIDSRDDLQLLAFVRGVGSQTSVRLTEVLPAAVGLGPHEFVLPVRVEHATTEEQALVPKLPIALAPVRRELGARFVYLQLFAPARQVDRLPLEINERMGRWLSRRALRWFYVKYSYPTAHLRLRVEVPADTPRWRLIRQVCEYAQSMRKDGLIDAFALTEFEPEVERYGGPERWVWSVGYFCADSQVALTVQRLLRDDDLDEDLLLLAMALSCLHVGLDFGVSLQDLAVQLRLPAETPNKGNVLQSSGRILRQFRPLIDEFSRGRPVTSAAVQAIITACSERSEQTRADRAALSASLQSIGRTQWSHWLYRCHAHMAINRLRLVHLAEAEPITLSLAARIASNILARGAGCMTQDLSRS